MFFFFHDTAPTEIYTLSLHDALPISLDSNGRLVRDPEIITRGLVHVDTSGDVLEEDRKSTRLNSSHVEISYAVFCLKKKKLNERNFFQQTPVPKTACNNKQVSTNMTW